MQQTTLSVPLEVKPQSYSYLSELIDRLKQREDNSNNPLAPNFDRLIRLVPSLHFMSMSVFPAAEYDPLFILEANFDGPPGPCSAMTCGRSYAVAKDRWTAMVTFSTQ
jgi:hypothetical protein